MTNPNICSLKEKYSTNIFMNEDAQISVLHGPVWAEPNFWLIHFLLDGYRLLQSFSQNQMRQEFQNTLRQDSMSSGTTSQSDQSHQDSPKDKSVMNSTQFFGGGKNRKKGTKQLYQERMSKYYCQQTSCVNTKSGGYGFKDEASVRRHLRQRHGYFFDKEVKKGQRCFVCPLERLEKYHSTLLKEHLLLQHKISMDGMDLKKLKKMYRKVQCFYCKERIPLAEGDQHMQSHGVKGKSFSEIQKKWNMYLKGRNRADQLNLNLQETFLNQLKGTYKKEKKTDQVQVDKLSYLINRQTYDLQKHGHFLILAMKNVFDLNNYMTQPVFYERLFVALKLFYKESAVIQKLKFPFQLQQLVQLQFGGLITTKMKFKKRKVDLAANKIYSTKQKIVKPTLLLYEHYFQLMVHDGFIAYNKSLQDHIEVEKKNILDRMNEHNRRFKEQRITQVRRVARKTQTSKRIIRGKMKKIQKKRNVITKQIQMEKFKRSLVYRELHENYKQILQEKYWFKTPRQIRFFNKVVFKKQFWQTPFNRQWDIQHGKAKQDESLKIVYRVCQRDEARENLLGRRPANPIRIPQFHLDPDDDQVIDSADLQERVLRRTAQYKRQIEQLMSSSSSSQETQRMTVREERWLSNNYMHCNVVLFRKDPEYRIQVMAYPFPELIHSYQRTKDEHQLHLSKIARNAEYRQEYESKMSERFKNLCLDNSRSSMSEVIGAKDGEISCPNPKCIGSNHFCHDMCPKGVAVRNSSGGRAGVYKDFVSSRKKTRF